MALDKQTMFRIATCGLEASTAMLADYGQPVPERREIVAHRPVVFPECCEALFVRPAAIREVTRTGSCLQRVEITWEVQLSRCVQLPDPSGGCADSGDPRDFLFCPDDGRVLGDGGPCSYVSKAEESAVLLADMWLFTESLAEAWKRCLCDPACAPYPAECASECRPDLMCLDFSFDGLRTIDGGGCGGFIATYKSRHDG